MVCGGVANYLRADPFRVTVKDIDFGTGILKPLFARSATWADRMTPESRWGEYSDDWIILHHLNEYKSKHSGKEHWVGTFFRAQTDDLQSKVGDEGISPLDLEEHEGVGEHVAFVWDVDEQIMWLQRDRVRARVGHFVVMEYLRERSKHAVALAPIYGDDGPAKAKKMQRLDSIEFAYESGADPNADLGPFGFLNSFKRYGFGRIDIKITRVRKSELKPAAKELVGDLAEFVEQDAESIAKAKVRGGLSAEAASEIIDLIKDRVEYKANIAKSKTRDPERLMQVMRQIYLANYKKVG